MPQSRRPSTVRAAMFAVAGSAALALVFAAVLTAQQPGPRDGEAQHPAPPRPLRLGVVDIDQALAGSEEGRDYLLAHMQLAEKRRSVLEKHERQLRILRNELEGLPPGTDKTIEKRAAIEAALRARERDELEFDRQIEARRIDAVGKIFNKVNAAIEQYARQHELDVVLKRQDLQVSPANAGGLSVLMATADVLYVNERYDITDEIIRQLNASYPGEIRER